MDPCLSNEEASLQLEVQLSDGAALRCHIGSRQDTPRRLAEIEPYADRLRTLVLTRRRSGVPAGRLTLDREDWRVLHAGGGLARFLDAMLRSGSWLEPLAAQRAQ